MKITQSQRVPISLASIARESHPEGVELGEPIGSDGEWVVDVVLRGEVDAAIETAVLDAVAAHPDVVRAPKTTYSYDMAPPDGSVGVSCWVHAATAGDAVDKAVRVVSAALRDATGHEHPLWDVRAIPGSAVFARGS